MSYHRERISNDDTITALPLCWWMCEHGYREAFDAAEAVKEIVAKRKKEKAVPVNPVFTFTAKELDAALERMAWGPQTEVIIQNILDHREPEWHEGDVVKDSLGRIFVRDHMTWDFVWTPLWVDPSNTPKRPLIKMEVKR